MPPLIPLHRTTEKAGVNATKSLFESFNYVFQEVDLGNDFGKDAYVDLVNGRELTGLCVALQIKSGESFRRSEGYAIPIGQHYTVWRNSSLPVAGIVFDPEVHTLFWCNITAFLENLESDVPACIPVSRDMVLDRVTLEKVFKPEMRRMTERRSVGTALLQLCSKSEMLQFDALSDCFAAGRNEPRVLILLRYLLNLLSGEPLKFGIAVLSHATPHPDIQWSKDNWISEEVRTELQPHLRWKTGEIFNMFISIAWTEWERGGVGQDLYMLLMQDPIIKQKMERVAIEFLETGQDEHAFGALYLCVYWAGKEARKKYQELVTEYPKFRSLDTIVELEYILSEHEYLTLF